MKNKMNVIINNNDNIINQTINNNNDNDTMRWDSRALIRIDDFDIDYSVFTISNRQIVATSHEQALARQEEGRVHEIERSSAYLETKQVIERSIRAVLLTRIRLNLDSSSSSNDDSKPSLPLTPEAFQVHQRIKQAKATLLKHFQLKHKMQHKYAAIKATQDACSFKIQRSEARRRLALVSATAAAVGRSRVRSHHHRHQACPEPSASASGDCAHLGYEDVCAMSTVQLLGVLTELRDSSCHDIRYALVQGELGARSMESQVTAFHAFLQFEEDKATRAISESRKAVAFEASTDSEQPHHGQAGLAQEKSHDGYVADNVDHHDDVASPVVEHISDLESWDPPLLPSLRRHVKWLPINTPSRFYEDLQAMNEFKTEQQARRSAMFWWLVAGIMFAALLISVPPMNSTMPQYRSDSALSPLTSLEASYSSMIYSSMELFLPPWSFRDPASMALTRTIISPRVSSIMHHQATARIALNVAVAESAELMSRSAAPDPAQAIKVTPIPEPSRPRQKLLMMDCSAIIGHPTSPSNTSLTTDSNSSSTLPCSQTTEQYASMAYASVELLLPPWSFRHSASMAVSTIVSSKAIAMVARHQATARIALNAAVAESAELTVLPL